LRLVGGGINLKISSHNDVAFFADQNPCLREGSEIEKKKEKNIAYLRTKGWSTWFSFSAIWPCVGV
jgi:hypothetical protein